MLGTVADTGQYISSAMVGTLANISIYLAPHLKQCPISSSTLGTVVITGLNISGYTLGIVANTDQYISSSMVGTLANTGRYISSSTLGTLANTCHISGL